MDSDQDKAIKIATGRALQAMREKRKLTKSQVAARAHTSFQQVDRWENGDHTPGTLNLAGLAEAYEVDTPKLFSEVARAIDKAKAKIREGE